MKRRSSFALPILLGTFLIMGCGQDYPTPQQASKVCPANVAEIGVGDHYFANICGCGSLSGTSITSASGSVFSCNAAAGSQIFFVFFRSILPHQILSKGSPGFDPSPVELPDRPAPLRIYTIQLKTPGTYAFYDAFTPDFSGQIVVQ